MGLTLFLISNLLSLWEWFDPMWTGVLDLVLYIGLLAIMGLLGLGIYLGALVLGKEFTRDDLKLFLDILNPQKMKHYVVSELRNKNDTESP
jgi:hypothetical protein